MQRSAVQSARRSWCIAALACAAACAGPVSADCLDWSTAQVQGGVIEALPGSGDTTWRLGIVPGGFGHQHEALALRWLATDGTPRHQLLFDTMASAESPQLELEPDADGLRVRRLDCEFRGPCRRRSMRFAYDAAAVRFDGVNHWGTFAFDPDTGHWRPAPPLAPAPVEASDCPAEAAFASPH